ncbi:MAG: CHAT domain-containing protein [Bacteroidales bacterium]|nr:CHAT domain-containing protein [Bacteroidales bacterium]
MNEAKDYLKAYRQILLAEQGADSALSSRHIQASLLSDNEFQFPYWPLLKTKAEISYMLGIHSVMEEVSDKLKLSLEHKHWANEDSATIRRGMASDLAKIDGSRFFLTERYDSSEVALERALHLALPFDHGFINAVHDDLAQLYYKQKHYEEALSHLDTILMSLPYQNDVRNPETRHNINIVQSQRALCLARLGRYDEALKEIEPICTYFKKINAPRSYSEALRKKAKIMMLQYDATGQYNPQAVKCYQDYLSFSRGYIDGNFVKMSESEREQYWMAEQPFVTDCFRLEDKAPELLYDVALYSKAVLLQMGRDFKANMSESERKNALSSIRVTWKQVRNKLSASSCAIEYIVYEKKDETHIGALIINRKSTQPKFIDIGNVNMFSDYSLGNGLKVKDVLADTQNRDKINRLYTDSTLFGIIWNEEMLNAIGDKNEVYFCPDGLFHQLGIEYMTPRTMEGKNLYRLTTTRLLMPPKPTIRNNKMLICGGVEYDINGDDQEKGNDELAYSLLASMNFGIDPLPYSSVEIDSIRTVREKYTEDKVLRADSVTESALTQLISKYHILHISTHGLFSEATKIGTDIHPAASDMQLSKSCLFLTGSGKNLKQKEFDASQHDGILSARELAKMDMCDIDLTVMSACMSGLGYITPDGVYGLQRGLKTAGVKTIISTLWNIHDEASCFFILQLYKHLEEGQTIFKAFWLARNDVRNYEKTYGKEALTTNATTQSYTQRRRRTFRIYDKPYFYNSFILIDGL